MYRSLLGAEHCEETWVTRKSDTASAEVTHLCVPKCKTFYVKNAVYEIEGHHGGMKNTAIRHVLGRHLVKGTLKMLTARFF
jgi:hypothetical protein